MVVCLLALVLVQLFYNNEILSIGYLPHKNNHVKLHLTKKEDEEIITVWG